MRLEYYEKHILESLAKSKQPALIDAFTHTPAFALNTLIREGLITGDYLVGFVLSPRGEKALRFGKYVPR